MTFMPTSLPTSFLSEIAAGAPIPVGKRAYFRERTKNRLYDFIVKKFLDQEQRCNLTRAELARRIGHKPEVITRWLGAPGNWQLDTVTDLLLGISAEELEPTSLSLLDRARRNFPGPDWIGSLPPPGATGANQSLDFNSYPAPAAS